MDEGTLGRMFSDRQLTVDELRNGARLWLEVLDFARRSDEMVVTRSDRRFEGFALGITAATELVDDSASPIQLSGCSTGERSLPAEPASHAR
jgi:hypothetical protein